MIEYANESVIRLLKQYDMLSKSLKYTTDIEQSRDISYQMTKIIQDVIELTNKSYEVKYLKIAKRNVYLMDEEKSRLLELINLVSERRAYVNNQVINNRELTGIEIDTGVLLGEDELDNYKEQVKVIDRYKNNIKLESTLKDEILVLDENIKRANEKINNNKNLNKQLEEKMIRILDRAFEKFSLFELRERKKEIDLAYTELGYSLEKAKENASIARRECTEKIKLECDNMLASITLEYERYKEKKLILKLLDIYKDEVSNYEELLVKREEVNNILMNITNSELYNEVGSELNKEYATIKLEAQDLATIKSLMDEKNLKNQTLTEIVNENNSETVKGLLSNLLENEKRYQEKLMLEKKKKEEERKEKERILEIKRKEEMAKRQKLLEEERKKEIEERTKQLLVEKKKTILMPQNENKGKVDADKPNRVIGIGKDIRRDVNSLGRKTINNSGNLSRERLEKGTVGVRPNSEIFSNKLDSEDKKEKTMDKVIITVVGKDTVGIIAKVCTYLSECSVNVLDISQTIVSDFFNMMMIVDMSASNQSFAEISSKLDEIGEEIGVTIKCQKEEIFEKMHRI